MEYNFARNGKLRNDMAALHGKLAQLARTFLEIKLMAEISDINYLSVQSFCRENAAQIQKYADDFYAPVRESIDNRKDKGRKIHEKLESRYERNKERYNHE